MSVSAISPTAAGRDDLAGALLPVHGEQPVEWIVSDSPVAYETATAFMEDRVAAIAEGRAPECVWLLEHPPLYTAGTSAQAADLIDAHGFPVYRTGRGGQYTYHGPGQRVAYVMLDLRRRTAGGTPDLRRFVAALEAWIIATLDAFNVRGERREDRVGVWVRRPEKGDGVEDKIAAIGIRVRRGVTFHGISLNVDPNLTHYRGIIPCGIRGHGVTSLVDLGLLVGVNDADVALRAAFGPIFGATEPGRAP